MIYFKTIDEDGFITISTLDAEEGGNSTKEEHDAIALMYRNAEQGYGVKEENGNLIYAKYPKPEEEITYNDIVEAYSILLGETP